MQQDPCPSAHGFGIGVQHHIMHGHDRPAADMGRDDIVKEVREIVFAEIPRIRHRHERRRQPVGIGHAKSVLCSDMLPQIGRNVRRTLFEMPHGEIVQGVGMLRVQPRHGRDLPRLTVADARHPSEQRNGVKREPHLFPGS